MRPQACRDSLAKSGQQDSRQASDAVTPSPSGFVPMSSSSRHCDGKNEKIDDHISCSQM